MSDETPSASALRLAYAGPSGLTAEGEGARLTLFADLDRPPVRLAGRLRDPLALREGLSALYEVVRSDLRYKPKDRSAWLAWQRRRGADARADAWQAQREYFSWIARNDPTAWLLLDPLISVSPDEVSFEVFSKDEGTWARLALPLSALELDGEPTCGTTNIDLSEALMAGVQRMRSYRPTRLVVGAEAAGLATPGEGEVMEKRIQVPDSWLRGFLQVQSAATLPATTLRIAAIDLYNLLRHLRLHADRKGEGRALRVELIPGEPPRLVLEPWELVLSTHAGPYAGRKAEVIRVWGRRRLSLIQRWLPRAEEVELHLAGSGLPSFWVLRGGGMSLTLGMTGFTAANWSQAATFDLLLPRVSDHAEDLSGLVATLEQRRLATLAELVAATGLSEAAVRAAMQRGCQEGRVMYDLARGVYRLRPVLGALPDPERLRFRNDRERQAHDLLAAKAVRLEVEHQVPGEGVELVGRVTLAAEKREVRPQLRLTEDGRVRQAECTCNFFRQHKLKEGPCAHLIALRLHQGRLLAERARARGGGREHVVVETRTYVRRRASGEDLVRVSLDRKELRVQWGRRGERLRAQRLVFNDLPDARDAYFARVEALMARGYLDATAG